MHTLRQRCEPCGRAPTPRRCASTRTTSFPRTEATRPRPAHPPPTPTVHRLPSGQLIEKDRLAFQFSAPLSPRGCRRRTCLLEDHSWTALTLEVGKSRPGCAGVAPRSAICEFASSGRALADPPTVRFSRDGRQQGEQDQEARARPAPGACATRPGHAVNMLADEERRCKREATPWRSIHAAPWLCAPLPAALPEPQSSRILRAACAHSQPPSRRVMAEHV